MLTIDGSQGEGGGQIVRSSIGLSLVTRTPITITNIRAGRKKPGLMRQHLAAVHAAAQIGQAKVDGAEIGSKSLSFNPGEVSPGELTFSVGTAGSTTLVLQTVLPALLLAGGPSKLTLKGGTHNPFAPPFDFLDRAYLPLVNQMGPTLRAELVRPGFYPAGGGQLIVHVQPADRLTGLQLHERGEITRRRVCAMVANLPAHIAQRECDTIARKSDWDKSCFEIREVPDAHGPGNVVIVEVAAQHVTQVFTGFGQKGKRAEHVARDVWKETSEYLKSDVPVGEYLADQLLLPLGIAAHQGDPGGFCTTQLTPHSTTHIEVLKKFLDIQIETRAASRNDVAVELTSL